MLNVAQYHVAYGQSEVLHGLDFTVAPGEIIAIMGRNGMGKTTLMKSLMGIVPTLDGAAAVNGVDITFMPSYERVANGIAYVPQGRHIIPDFTIRENIIMGSFAAENGSGKIPDIVADIFPYLIENLDRPGGVLSGGQQQQLAIARALAAHPKVILMDEPTEGIQPNIVQQIEDTIIRLNSELGSMILLVEQNVGFARRAGHSFAMLENGRVVEAGKISALTDEVVNQHMTI